MALKIRPSWTLRLTDEGAVCHRIRTTDWEIALRAQHPHITLLVDPNAEHIAETVAAVLEKNGSVQLLRVPMDQQVVTTEDAFSSDCILMFLSDLTAVSPSSVADYCVSVAPAPVLLVADGIATLESSLMGTGVEDCLDSVVMPPEAIVRATQRCIDRAAQRVHISTAERRYNDLFDSMPVAAFRISTTGEIQVANRAFLRLMQAESQDEVRDLQLNGLLTGLSALLRSCPENTPEYRDQHIFDALSGGQRHVVVSARAGRSRDEQPVMDVFVTDVTEQEEQTRRVVKAENRLRDLYDNVPIMMFEVDTNFAVQQPNRTMLKQLGYPNEMLVGRTIAALLHEDEDPEEVAESIALIKSGDADVSRPLRLKCFDGSLIECLYTVTPALGDTGQVRGAHAMLVDVTAHNTAQRERDELQEQLQLSQKLDSIGELAAGIAHEINTPAQYVSDNLSFLMESFDDLFEVIGMLPETVSQFNDLSGGEGHAQKLSKAIEDADIEYLSEEIPSALTQGHDGIGKIREIVLALKDFSHPGSGTMDSADLNRIIESTVTVARNEWKYVAKMNFALDQQLPAVKCFSSAISQVVLNIVVNAAHAIGDARQDGADEMGEICIGTSLIDDETVLVTIRDDGPGIPESVKRKIFDPFFTTKEVGRGTGQGLAISRSVVMDQHGGTISVESEIGQGSEFRIELPLNGKVTEGINEEAA